MPSRYAQWMYDWEHRLTSVDNNRVVRPLEWGVEWARDWPCRNGCRPGQVPENPEKFILDYNQRIVAASDDFMRTPSPPTSASRSGKCRSSPRVRFLIPARSESERNSWRIPSVHFAGEVALSGKQSGECPLVPGTGTARRRVVASLELRRRVLRQPL